MGRGQTELSLASIPEVTQNKVDERGGEGREGGNSVVTDLLCLQSTLGPWCLFYKTKKIYIKYNNNNEMVGQRKNNTNQLFVNFKIKFIMQLREIGFATLKSTTFI